MHIVLGEKTALMCVSLALLVRFFLAPLHVENGVEYGLTKYSPLCPPFYGNTHKLQSLVKRPIIHINDMRLFHA